MVLSRVRITGGESRETLKNGMRAVCVGRNSTYKWYARGMREAFARLVHTSPGNIACGFWGLPSGPLCGDPAGASRNPQGTLQDPFREPPRGPYSPPSPPPSPPPGWVWYVHGMRMVCARYARMVIVAWSLQWDPEGGPEWGPVCAPNEASPELLSSLFAIKFNDMSCFLL